MFASLNSMGLRGIDGFLVEVEADLSQGLPGFDVVGLPDTAVRESRDRVRAAMKNAGFTYPVSRITVNLAPADVKKEGSVYDLPLLLALLIASGQLRAELSDAAFIGELSLQGTVRPVRGVLPMVIAARDAGCLSPPPMGRRPLWWRKWRSIRWRRWRGFWSICTDRTP